MNNVVNMAFIKDDNSLITPEQCLEEALREIKSGERKCNKVLILTLDDTERKFNNGYYCANMRVSEMLSLCSNTAHWMNRILDGEE